MIKGIIFDYGGTLDSGGEHWSEVIWRGWQNAGIEVGKDLFRDAYVHAERELARVRHILPEDNFLQLMRKKVNIELQYLSETLSKAAESIPAYLADVAMREAKADEIARYCDDAARRWVERARPLLEDLSKMYPMVLVSNFYGNVEAVLAEYGIRRYFRDIVESAVVGVRKPDPQIFRLGVESLGLKGEEVLVVGDSLRKDILPARQCGCKTAWLKGKGWTAEEDAQTDPDVIPSLEALRPLLLDAVSSN